MSALRWTFGSRDGRHALLTFATLILLALGLAIADDACAVRVEGGDVKIRIGAPRAGVCP